MSQKYVVFGSGAVGSSIAGMLSAANMDVTLISRGEAYNRIKENGLIINKKGSSLKVDVPVALEQDYADTPDIIFVCVKSYSLEKTYEFIKRVCGVDTVVIPVLNGLEIGERIQKTLPEITVAEGCIYISAYVENPGVIRLDSEMFKIAFGMTDGSQDNQKLRALNSDLRRARIWPIYSKNIKKEMFEKFSFTSAYAAAGTYLQVNAGEMQKDGESRELFTECVTELVQLATAMDIQFDKDMVAENLRQLDGLEKDATSSMYKDIADKRLSEFDELVTGVVQLAKRFGINLPRYTEIFEGRNG